MSDRDGNGFAVVAGIVTFKGFFLCDMAASRLAPSLQDEAEDLLNGCSLDAKARADLFQEGYDDGYDDGFRDGTDAAADEE